MFLKIFNQKSQFLQWIVIPLLLVAATLKSFFEITPISGLEWMPLLSFMHSAMPYEIMLDFMNVFSVLILYFLLNYLAEEHELFPDRNALSKFIFTLVFCSLVNLKSFGNIDIVYIAFFILLSRLFKPGKGEFEPFLILDIGLMFGIVLLLKAEIIFYLPFVLITILLLKPFNSKEPIIFLLGASTTLILFFGFDFLFNSSYYWSTLYKTIPQFTFNSIQPKEDFHLLIWIGFALLGIPSYVAFLNLSVVKLRNIYLSILVLAINTFAIVLFVKNAKSDFLFFLVLPITLLVLHYLKSIQKNWIVETILTIFIGLTLIQLIYF
jgi:hypothetical protein